MKTEKNPCLHIDMDRDFFENQENTNIPNRQVFYKKVLRSL